MLPCIFSLAGTALTPDEGALFSRADPAGFILFARNLQNEAQIKRLTATLKETARRDCPILIDQEGGRVARLRPPLAPEFKPAGYFGDLYAQNPQQAERDLAAQTAEIAGVLTNFGINVNCAPVLDLRYPGAHDIIGDRAFSADPQICATLGDIVCRAYLENGITPVIKHGPGHGRALSDSHHDLPTVDVPLDELDRTDFLPFREISKKPYAKQLWLMTAHIVYPAVDPATPATLSAKIMKEIVRGRIGFPGTVVGDDMDMKALDAYGDITTRTMDILAAGCDLALNCHGKFSDMERLAAALPQTGKETLNRLAASGLGRYAA